MVELEVVSEEEAGSVGAVLFVEAARVRSDSNMSIQFRDGWPGGEASQVAKSSLTLHAPRG